MERNSKYNKSCHVIGGKSMLILSNPGCLFVVMQYPNMSKYQSLKIFAKFENGECNGIGEKRRNWYTNKMTCVSL